MDIIELMKKEMLRRRLSRRTIKTYLFYVRKFMLFCHKEPREFSKKDIREFLEQKGYLDKSGSTTNVALMSLRFMMEEVLRKNMRLNIRYSKTPKSKPEFLAKEEAVLLIRVIENRKHRLIVSLMYGSGLRVSEAVNLRKEDLDLNQGIGWVRHGKGNKDRPFIIPECLKKDLADSLSQEGCFVFPGRQGHLSVKSVEMIVKKAAKKAGIRKNVHPHTLRHSFATHLIESGCDIIQVQSLLGHNEARTTMDYLHMAKPRMMNIKSPID